MERAAWAAADRVLRSETGLVIPVYFPSNSDPGHAADLLRDNVLCCLRHCCAPEFICLSVDGHNPGLDAASQLAREHGLSIVVNERNMGKLGALRSGAALLLGKKESLYIAVVDQDGDQFANELVNLTRAALQIKGQTGNERVLVIGRRNSRSKPMGFFRGELEEFADRVLLDALAYRAVIKGEPLQLEYVSHYEEYPDFHSGFKLFSPRSAEDVFLSEIDTLGLPEPGPFRHAVEAVMTVEAMEKGAYLGIVSRSAVNTQPVSAFGQFKRVELVSDKIIWPCRRLGVPGKFVAQWMLNHLGRLQLNTLTPAGTDELRAIIQRTLEFFPDSPRPDFGSLNCPGFI